MKHPASATPGDAEVVRLNPARSAAADAFLRWQCRARQFAVRRDGGRPGAAMRPKVLSLTGAELSPGIVTLLIESEPGPSTDIFRQMYRRTHDPAERRAAMLELLAGSFFQDRTRFSDTLTALFAPESSLASRIGADGACLLRFDDGATRLELTCRVDVLDRPHPFHQATWYHGVLFNPSLPSDAQVLAFAPDWARSGPPAS